MMLVAPGSTPFVVVGSAAMDFKIFVEDDGGNFKAGSEEKKFIVQYNKVRCRKRIINFILMNNTSQIQIIGLNPFSYGFAIKLTTFFPLQILCSPLLLNRFHHGRI